MEGADDLYKTRWASKLAEYRPECSSVHSVEYLGEIDKEQVDVLVLLNTFFLELPDSKVLDMVFANSEIDKNRFR